MGRESVVVWSYLLKHETGSYDERRVLIDPFIEYQEGRISKGRLCEIIAEFICDRLNRRAENAS